MIYYYIICNFYSNPSFKGSTSSRRNIHSYKFKLVHKIKYSILWINIHFFCDSKHRIYSCAKCGTFKRETMPYPQNLLFPEQEVINPKKGPEYYDTVYEVKREVFTYRTHSKRFHQFSSLSQPKRKNGIWGIKESHNISIK